MESAGAAVTKVTDKTVLLKTVDLPSVSRLSDEAGSGSDDGSGGRAVKELRARRRGCHIGGRGPVGAVAEVVKLYIEVEWFGIRLAANEEGVTLRGQYLPPTPVLIPTGNS